MKKYLAPRLERAPDLSSIGAGRRSSCGCSGDCRALAEVGAGSEQASGASQTSGRELRSSGSDSALFGFRQMAGGQGGYLLHLRLDGTLREVAGGPGSDSG